ncbi:hypothetical protein ASD11_07615 [Aeromicrobium sp. Root495]|uniref:RDD family protein n=1 Tax=Aeromicrobium sp. Root495 TaxID=1736550 RepID=UPI0006F6FE12|nr:RDD family protein [Aeromicrobium sp. Root495]KQY59424.1 hypothetical protein ASD11_07615 [Aeromicrobium sp. Root495]RYJ05915.1 MAG: hypothetical protein EON52_09080 [Actinomycetales bacterium]
MTDPAPGTRSAADDVLQDDRPVSVLRRSALAQDVLLFCVAFSAGALFYVLVRLMSGDEMHVWGIGLSDEVLLSGLVAGELFVLWNNGLRQGLRGHSIGKHREGLMVVDAATGRPAGPWRGLLRGAVMVVLLDLALAAVPVNLPTVLRRATPDAWHFGGAAYLALLVLLVPVVLGAGRGLADRVARTRVERATGLDAHTRPERLRALVVLDVVGVLGVVAVCSTYLSFYWPLLWRFPKPW